jgi:hypothetical protein
MDTPYYVEERRVRVGCNYEYGYAITRPGEDDLCLGSDVVFMHKLVELLNADEQDVEGR